jgi:hypothetical protein
LERFFHGLIELISKDRSLMNTLLTAPQIGTASHASQRLRTTMAAIRLAFTWLGVRKTLNHA